MSSEIAASFRAKAAQMKSWRPDSTPSNRDRLELYALHKQAVSGDVPTNSPPSTASVGEKAKFQAWKSKKGISQQEAMLAYVAEANRQVRVYGNAPSANPQTPQSTPNVSRQASQQPPAQSEITPRGIAAIPLLCAAAAESRPAYLRRLAATTPATGWWSRQETLCANPGTLWALPETLLLALASLVEYLSLVTSTNSTASALCVSSFLWPTHNTLLAIWMLCILLYSIGSSSIQMLVTILWGSTRTGLTLTSIWQEDVRPCATSIHALTESHQSMSVRLVGLALLPYTTLVETICDAIVGRVTGLLGESLVHASVILLLTWWYWWIVLPWLAFAMLVVAFWSGTCFALIDMAGV